MKNLISIEQNAYQPPFRASHQRRTEGSGLLHAIFFTLRLFQQWGRHYLFPAILSLIILPVLICCHNSSGSKDGTSGGHGSLRLKFTWNEETSEKYSVNQRRLAGGDVCTDYRISWIHINAIDESGIEQVKATWPCDLHRGQLTGVPAGTYRINIQGEVANDLAWRGEIAGVKVNNNQETDAGLVKMAHLHDHLPPVVVQTIPADQATTVPTNISLTATFDAAIVPRSINADNFKLTYTDNTGVENPVECTVKYDTVNNIAMLIPAEALTSEKTYTAAIVVDQELVVEDMAGIPMQSAVVWTFTTILPDSALPRIQSANPAQGQMDVTLDTSVQIGFSEQINSLTINTDSFYLECNDTIIPAGVIYDGRNQTATLSPENELPSGTTCTATVTTAITDLAGNPMEGDETWSFFTRIGPWHIEPVDDFMAGNDTAIALDSKETPYIGFAADGEMKYSVRDSEGNWTNESIGETGGSPYNQAMTMGINDTLHFVYYQPTTSQLQYFYEGLFIGPVRGANITSGINCDGVAIATNDTNDAHVCFFDETNSQLKYAAEESGWIPQIVHDVSVEHPSIAVSPSGTVHITYYDETNHTLTYAAKPTDSAWAIETIDSDVGYHSYSDIALDSSGAPHVSYVNDDTGDLKYAVLQNSGGWLIETVDSEGFVGNLSSITLDSSNRAHISYLDGSALVLKYATKTALGTWYTQVVDSDTPTGSGTSIVLDSQGNVHISYCNLIAGSQLKYATTRPPD